MSHEWLTDVLGTKRREHLRKFGVEMLTGEADGTTMGRILCDLNHRGVELWTEFLGGNAMFTMGSNWNSKVDGEEAVASVLASVRLLDEFLVFAHVRAGRVVVEMTRKPGANHCWYGAGGIVVFDTWDEWRAFSSDRAITNDYDYRAFSLWPSATAGTRNVHQMTGRTI